MSSSLYPLHCPLPTPPLLLRLPPQLSHCPAGIKAVAHTGPPASSAPGGWGFYWGGVHEELPQVVSQSPPVTLYNSPGQIAGLQSAPATWEEGPCEEAPLGEAN